MPEREQRAMPQKTEYDIILDQAIAQYREQREKFPLKKGDIVATEDDPMSYKVRRFGSDGSVLIGYRDRKTRRDVTKQVPESQLFDVNIVK